MTDEEICPLCLDGYAPVDEAICAACAAPSCPGCVEPLDDASQWTQETSRKRRATTRCFACRPALVPPPVHPPGAPVQPLAAHGGALPPPLPRRARGAQPPPPPAMFAESAEPDEGGLVVFPAWRKRPLLALARAADAVHLVEVSSILVGWAHTGGRRFAFAERVSRVSRAWTLRLRTRSAALRMHSAAWRARSAGLRRLATRLSLPLLSGLRVRGAALSQALKVRTLVLAARTADLSRRLPQAARAAWSRVPH